MCGIENSLSEMFKVFGSRVFLDGEKCVRLFIGILLA